jgi:hypothetical protein
MVAIANHPFAKSLNVARTLDNKTATELSKAEARCQLDPTFLAFALDRDPVGVATMLRKVADIAETLPALREARSNAATLLATLAQHACYRCDGTGTYSGATNARRGGHAYCFYCNGSGDARSK